MIGLQRGIVKLVPYDPHWAHLFAQEKTTLQNVLNEYAPTIEHIGSTAIPSIVAKPVIDIAVGIKGMNQVEKVKNTLEKNDWIWRPKFGDIQNHIVFAKGNNEERTHYLHLMEYGGKIWNEKILFRDYLISHEQERLEYEKIKLQAMEKHGDDRKVYTAQKDLFVENILKIANSLRLN